MIAIRILSEFPAQIHMELIRLLGKVLHQNTWIKLQFERIPLGCAECRVLSDEDQSQWTLNMKRELNNAFCFAIEWFNWIIALFGEIAKLHLYLPFKWIIHFTSILWTNYICKLKSYLTLSLWLISNDGIFRRRENSDRNWAFSLLNKYGFHLGVYENFKIYIQFCVIFHFENWPHPFLHQIIFSVWN